MVRPCGTPCVNKKEVCIHQYTPIVFLGLPRWLSGKKNLPASAGDTGYLSLIPGLGRSSGEGNGNPLQDSCLENPVNRGAGRTTVREITKESDTTEQLSTHIVFRHNATVHLLDYSTM